MKRFPVDNMSPGRSWKRIYAPPNDSDSDSSSDSDNSTMECMYSFVTILYAIFLIFFFFTDFRSIYNSYGDYATSRSCTQVISDVSFTHHMEN